MRELHIGAIWRRPATALAKRLLHGFARRRPNAAVSASAPKQERGAPEGARARLLGGLLLWLTRVVGPRVGGRKRRAENIAADSLCAILDTLEVAVDRVAYDR